MINNENGQYGYSKFPLITEDGMFYSNFTDKSILDLFLMEDSGKHSPNLAEIKEKYGIKIGTPQASGSEEIDENTIGVYIVNWQEYLEDIGYNKIDDSELTIEDIEEEKPRKLG